MGEMDVKSTLLEAAKPHVPFDGWSEATFKAAVEDAGLSMGVARAACPRGAVDLALAYHEEGDARMLKRAAAEADYLASLRYSERVAALVRFRLEAVEDRELVRRGVTLFALPHHALDGARAIWGTCDRIWEALGDTSDDVNWYTKRATLSGVYSSTVLYWLGDDSPGHVASWDFLERRIADVMAFEKVKGQLRDSKIVQGAMAGPLAFLSKIRKPGSGAMTGLPGRWTR